MAWIEHRSDSFTVCYREGGKRQRISGVRTQRQAQALADEIDRVQARGQVFDRQRRPAPTWSVLVDKYTEWAAQSGRRAASTMRSMAASLDLFETWMLTHRRRNVVWCDEIQMEELEGFHAWMLGEGYAEMTAEQYVVRVRTLLRWGAKRTEWRGTFLVPERPDLRPARPLVDPVAPSWDACDLAIAEAFGWVRQAFIVGRATGLRLAQVMHLKREDVDLATRVAHIRPDLQGSKTLAERGGRWLPLPDWLVDEFATWGRWEGWLVDRTQVAYDHARKPDPERREIRSTVLRTPWKRAGVDVPQPFHALRKAHMTGLAIAGVPADHVDYLQGRVSKSLGGRTYTEWVRLLEPVLRPAVALVAPIGHGSAPASLDDARDARRRQLPPRRPQASGGKA